MLVRTIAISSAAILTVLSLATPGKAAKATVAKALTLTPTQQDVAFDTPAADEVEKCTIESRNDDRAKGWVIYDEGGRLLRQFLDTNGDNKLDHWHYYKDGIEVYRDVDSDFDGKADQYRWLGTAGIRWGLDRDQDGSIDAWKMISAEEVTAEVVAALRSRDTNRFENLLLTATELKSLGLGEAQAKQISQKIEDAPGKFREIARRQDVVGANTGWIHFAATRPGVVPIESGGAGRQLIVYDNVAAVVETHGKHAQVVIGTLVRVGDNWRIIDAPANLIDAGSVAGTGFFFQAPVANRPNAQTAEGLNEALQKLIAELEKVEQELAAATSGAKQAALNGRRADVLEKLVAGAPNESDRENWIRQLADTISAAVQSGSFAGGTQRLEAFHRSLQQKKEKAELLAYVQYRLITAAYGESLQDADADFAKIQEKWLADLKQFVSAHPKSPDAAEAMLQLGLAEEFAGKDDAAIEWYGRVAANFAPSQVAKKAAGAKRRLESVGKTLTLEGKTFDGQSLDLARYAGRTVLIHFWATWCEPCKQDLVELRRLQAKYTSQGFSLIGISVDNEREALVNYLRANRLPWPQLYEPGGLNNRLATELGVLTLPTMLLVGKDGKVVNRNVHVGELDAELGRQLRNVARRAGTGNR